MSIELLITDDNKGLFLELLSGYLQLAERNLVRVNKVNEPTRTVLRLTELPLLSFENGDKVSEDELKVAEVIARVSGFYEVIYGKTDAEIKSNLDFINEINSKKTDISSLLCFLNKHLLTNTFCNGFLINISDIFAYSAVAPTLKNLSDADKYTNCNVIRWADHLQHLKGIEDRVSQLQLKFNLPYEPFFLDVVEIKKAESKKAEKKAEGKKGEKVAEGAEKQAEGKEKSPNKKKPEKSVESNSTTITSSNPEEKGDGKKVKKEKEKKPQPEKAPEVPPASKLDIRVGKVVSICINENSEKLYNEEIDVGNGEIRKIASGLKGKVDLNDLKDSLVIVLCNLEVRPLCGWPSHGMVLCASDSNDKTEPLRPPTGSKAGDLVYIGDLPRQPAADKKNPWKNVYPELSVNDKKEATLQGTHLWRTENGIISTPTLTNAKIS